MSHKVYVTEPIHPAAERRLAEALPVEIGDPNLPREEIMRRLGDVTMILSKTDPILIDRQILEAAPKLVHVARHGSGYSNVDLACATEKGVSVSYLSGINTVAIAEYTFGFMLLLARNLIPAVERTRGGAPDRHALLGTELFGKTLGIVGLGAIGIEVARRANAFGMRVLAYHPRPEGKDFGKVPVTLVGFNTLLRDSDFVSLHAPLTAETRHMIGAEELEKMKPTAHLLNLGRGGIIDEKALCAALKAGRIAGAALDVMETEPVRNDEPLLQCPRCLVLPHIAAMTEETQARVAMAAVENLLAVSKGQRPEHLANPSAWSIDGPAMSRVQR